MTSAQPGNSEDLVRVTGGMPARQARDDTHTHKTHHLEIMAHLRESFDENCTQMRIPSSNDLKSLERSALCYLLEVRHLLNQRALILQLPVDVFLMVCENAVQQKSWRPVLGGFRDRESWPISVAVNAEYIQPLLTLTHVCRAWRNVVIDASSFWAYADSARMTQPLFDMFVERAGAARLFHAFNASSTSTNERMVFDALVSPLRHLTIHFKHSVEQQYHQCFPLKAPELESVTIVSGADIPDVAAPPYLFHERTSPLRALAISPVSHFLPQDSFPNLTHLFLSFALQEIPSVDPLDDLLRLLSQAAKIQYLGVFELSRIFPPQDPSTHPRLHVPQMRNLTIRDTHWLFPHHLLGHLSFREDIHIYSNGLWLSQQDRVNGTIPRMPHVHLPFITRLKIEARCGRVYVVEEGPLDSTQRPKGRLDFTFTRRSRYYDDDPWENTCLRSIPAYTPALCILTLHVSLHAQLQLEFANNVIPHMENLVELVVLPSLSLAIPRREGIDGNAALFTGLLSVFQQTNPVVCPALSDLAVMVFITGTRPSQSQLVLNNILEIVRARAKIGRPLRRFLIQPSNSVFKQESRRKKDRFDTQFEMEWLQHLLEDWVDSIRQVVEVVESVWDFAELDMEVFTQGSFCADEDANVEQYWQLASEYRPWALLPV